MADANGADGVERRLADAAEAVRQREIVGRHCEELIQRADAVQREVAELRVQLADEREDVERLEGVSLTRVMASLRGVRHDGMARERAEAEAVALKLQAAEYRLSVVRREHDAMRARWDASAEAPAALDAALDEKEALLSSSSDQRAPRIMALAEERGRLSGDLTELAEAIAAADRARQALDFVAEKLGSASSWSTYDTWFGGGMLASAMKHDHVDAAARAAQVADQHLAVLRTELADVGVAHATGRALDIGTGTVLLDVMLDNVFTDWAVADRIDEARQGVEANLGMVAHLRSDLERRTAAVHSRLDALAAQRHTLLTTP